MDIDGLGSALIEQLVDKGLIKDFGDLYYLKKEELSKLDRMAEKSSDNVIRAINNSKNRPLSNLIYALGIRYVGSYASKLLSKKINNLLDLKNMTEDDFINIAEIGPKIAKSIVLFFKKEENLKIIKKLEEAGLNLSSQENGQEEQTLKGMQFVLTGSLESFTRDEAKKEIERLGGRVTGNVTKNTDYLILGKDPGQKYQKAKEIGINILEENNFKNMLKNS
jgi:DNA ligase (NAD+)